MPFIPSIEAIAACKRRGRIHTLPVGNPGTWRTSGLPLIMGTRSPNGELPVQR
jgi:hypothetical protein